MIKLGVAHAILFALLVGIARGQGSAPATITARTPNQPSDKASPAKIPSERSPAESDPARKADEAKNAAAAQEPIITEIYADKTVFDSAKSIGIFTGHIVVTDPRFSIQGDKLTIYLGKKQNES